jgi:hypothetical protein
VIQNIRVNNLIVGVGPGVANAPADFNVLAGITGIPIIVEGHGTRVAGNFIGVMPDGLHDANLSLDPALAGSFSGFIQIGRGEQYPDRDRWRWGERRPGAEHLGSALPTIYGYPHNIEFYDPGGHKHRGRRQLHRRGGGWHDDVHQWRRGAERGWQRAVYRFGSNLDGRAMTSRQHGVQPLAGYPVQPRILRALYPNA